MNPEEYRQQINALGIGELKKMSISNQYDAEKILERVLRLQESLRYITQEINTDIHMSDSPHGDSYQEVLHDVDTLLSRLDRLRMQLEDYIQKAVEEKPTKAPPRIREFCPRCGNGISQSDKFCGNCGQKLCCPVCGSLISQSDKFCGNCGQKLWVI